MDCALCEEPITNPLCQGCLGEAVEQWLHETAPERVHELHACTETLKTEHGLRCIRCKNRFRVCPYCAWKEFFNALKDGKTQLAFLQYFNFLT